MDRKEQFVRSIEETVKRIAENPFSFPIWEGNIRRALTSKYPFQIFYWIESETMVKIVAVSHTSRKPVYWAERVG